MQRLALLFTLLLATPVWADTFEDQLGQAQQAFSQADYSNAIALLKQALSSAQSPQQLAQGHNALGWTYFKEKRYDLAKQHLQQALQLAKESGDQQLARKASNNLGVLAYTTGDYEQAQSQFSAAPSRESTAASTYLNLIQQQQQVKTVNQHIAAGVSYRRKGDFANAIKDYDQALKIDPNNARALEYKGYAQFRLGQTQQAITTLTRANRVDPNRINVLINLMKSYCGLGDQRALQQLISRNANQLGANKDLLKRDGELRSSCGNDLLLSLP